MKPMQVKKSNEHIVSKRINKNTAPVREINPPQKFQIGDKVRISKHIHIFTKGYLPNWANEVFTIHRVQPPYPETYILKDNKGEVLQGGFYGHELLRTKIGDVFLVERVLKRKGYKILVRWIGFDKTHDSWISKKDLV